MAGNKIFSKIELNRNCGVPLYLQIKNHLKKMILQGFILQGKPLPPTRIMAKAIGVNRSTVVLAYDELLSEGLVVTYVGKGTIAIKSDEEESSFQMPLSLRWSDYFASYTSSVYDQIIMESSEWLDQENTISLAGGDSSPELYPVRDIEIISKSIFKSKARTVLRASSCQGILPLREMISNDLIREGKATSPDEVIIVSGSLQGLSLLSRIFLDPGDLVVVESPTFLGALQVFRAAQARIMGVSLDENGLRTDILENILSRQKPKFIYVLPTYQNPSGAVLSLERREKLLNLAYKYQVAIIEEDPYSKIYFDKEPPPSLKSLDKSNLVIHLGTFSKMLFPGLRIGWIIASNQIIRRLVKVRQFDDMHSNTLGQYVFYEFYKSKLLEKHLISIRVAYARKRDIMISNLSNYCTPFMTWNKPEGGFYIWCKLKRGLRSSELFRELLYKNVSVIPGGAFFWHASEGEEWLRLNFTYEKEYLIEKGIKILGEVSKKIIAERKAMSDKKEFIVKPLV